MKISTVLDGEQITIINVTGDVKNQAITYIDSNNVLKVKVLPMDWTRKSIFGTSSEVNSPGSAANPFTSTAERDAIMPAGVPRRECYMLNEFAPLAPGVPGLVKWIDTGSAWILAPEQVLANYSNANGSPILDTTASALGLTPGTFAEIWTSPVLPLWLLDGGYRSFFVEVNRANLEGNTSQTTITASIRGASATSSIYDNMLTYQQANNSAWRGPSILGTSFRKVGGNLVGVEGPNQLAQREGNKWVGTYVENNTRIRIGYTAGASSDLILIHSAVIKNGVC